MEYVKSEQLTKTIRGNTVLDQVCFSVQQNEIAGFVGRNGCGKTMLFRAVCGLIKPTSGAVWVGGRQIGKEVSFPPNTGTIIENVGLWNGYTGYENLRLLTKIGKNIPKEQIRHAIERVGLDPDLKKTVGKYSLGMKQRIVIAQAIMEQPELLVLDEPTNGLDEAGVALIRNVILEEKARGATILLASHNDEDIKMLCDTIFYMENGRITEEKRNADAQ